MNYILQENKANLQRFYLFKAIKEYCEKLLPDLLFEPSKPPSSNLTSTPSNKLSNELPNSLYNPSIDQSDSSRLLKPETSENL